MKQILALILTVLLVFGMFAPSVLAAEEPNVSAVVDSYSGSGIGSDISSSIAQNTVAPNGAENSAVPEGFDYTGSVISITTPAAIGVTFNMDCGDTGFTQLHNALDSVVISGIVGKGTASYVISMTVTWDFSTVDAGTPGNYTVIGRICVPEGAALSDGLENTVSILVQVNTPVLTVSPSAITLTSFDEPDRTDAVAFAVGTSQEELAEWFAEVTAGFTGYDADGNSYDLISSAWSFETVNTATPGVYYASATPDLGTEYTLANGVAVPRQLCAVSIQTSGEPDINCCVSGRGFLHFTWILSAEQQELLEEFTVWLLKDDGDWTGLSGGFCFTSEDFQLSQQILQIGSSYQIKVTYPGGQTGVLSFKYDGVLSIVDYSDGDRDGGDVNGGGSGTGTQPALLPPQTPSYSPEDYSPNRDNNTPAQENSSSESNEPNGEQDSSSGETQLTPTTPQAPNDSQNNGSYNSDTNSTVQLPVTVKPGTGISTPTTKLLVPVYTGVFLPNKVEDALPEPGNYVVPQPEEEAKTMTNPIPKGNDIQSEKIPESQEPATVTEAYSPAQTVISGMRLRDLCKDEESVVFGSGDLTVSIPSKLLLALNLSDSDTLSVNLTQPGKNQIMLAVEVSGKSVMELVGTALRLRYMPQSENTKITVKNEAGEQIKNASYNGEFLRFTVDAAGTYTILEQSNTLKEQKDMLPLLTVSGGLILAVGGIVFFRRKCHG